MYPICVVLMQKIGYPICVEICLSLSVSSIISASSDRRRMQRSSLEPPHRAASNGGGFIPLRPLDAEIIDETLNERQISYTYRVPDFLHKYYTYQAHIGYPIDQIFTSERQEQKIRYKFGSTPK